MRGEHLTCALRRQHGAQRGNKSATVVLLGDVGLIPANRSSRARGLRCRQSPCGDTTAPSIVSATISDGRPLDKAPSHWSCPVPFRTSFASLLKKTFDLHRM